MAKGFVGRTRFDEIVAEFAPPVRPSARVAILCPGMPTGPSRASLVEFFSKKGFWCFAPRYRGSWESGGEFLKISPEKDIAEIVDGMSRGFKDAYSEKTYRVKNPVVYLFGFSFGGPAALLLSRDRRVAKVILVSPVVDWRARSKDTSISEVERFARVAFGDAYRSPSKHILQKLAKGNFYNPATALKKIDGTKVFIIHAKDDRSVSFGPLAKFAKKIGASFWPLKNGGHLSSSFVTKPNAWKKIKKFVTSSPY
jgi:esterase/lipase